MKKIIAATIAGLALAAGASPAYAYQLNLSECRDSLRGVPSTNDNEVRQARAWLKRALGDSKVYDSGHWSYRDYRYVSAYDVRQSIYIEATSGQQFRFVGECFDGNASGQVSSKEDWLANTP